MNDVPGATIDPNPRRVRRSTGTVCYNMGYQTGGGPTLYNLLFLKLHKRRELHAHYDDTTYTFPACIAFVNDPPELDLVYVR